MAIKRYGINNYAVVEINKFSAPDTNGVFAQLPLDTVDFADHPCENGMWLVYDEVKGTAHIPTNAADHVGVMYLNEKEYGAPTYGGLNTWALKINGYCPRVYFNKEHDTYTTNCFCYDTAEFANDAAVDTALKDYATTTLYLVPGVGGDGAPKLTKTAPAATVKVAAQVCKDYTLPNGDHGVKFVYIKA